MRLTAAVLALSLAAPLAAPAAAQGSYQITHTYALGGNGSWDYVVPDPATHRVYIGRSNRVMVVDETTGKLVGEVMGINGAHGTAVVDKLGRGFATSGEDSSIVMFDLKTFKPLGKIHAAEDADAIVYDPVSNRVFSFNGDANSSTVVDPVAMAVDMQHQRLFSGCRSGVMAISDYRAGKVITTVPIGAGVDGAGFDPGTENAFASGADGTLTVIHEDSPNSFHVVQTLTTMTGSRNMGLDPSTHTIFLSGAKFEPQPAGARGRPKMVPGSYVLLEVERR